MKKTFLILLSSFLLFACANSVEIDTNIKKSIINFVTNKQDTIYVKEFSEFNKADIGKIDSVDNYSKIKIQKFSSKNMDDLVSKKKITCVIFWTPCRSGCDYMLDSAYRDIIKEHQKDVNFAVISISNVLKSNQKKLFKLKYFMQTYVLDPNLYKSTSETNDWPIFEAYLKDQFPNEKIKMHLPYVLVMNKDKKIISYHPNNYELNILLSKIK